MEINTIVVINVLKKFSAKLTTERVSSLLRLSDATAKRLVYGYPKGEPHWVDEANWVATKDKTEDDIEDDIEVKDSFSKQFVWAFVYCFQKYLMSDLQVAKRNIIVQLMKQNVSVNDTEQITAMSDFRSIAEYLVNSACANYVKRRSGGDDSVLVVQEAHAQIPLYDEADSVQGTFDEEKSKRSREKTEYQDALKKVYRVSCDYRDAIRTGIAEKINAATDTLQEAVQRVFYIGERLRIVNKAVSINASEIVEQFNKYILAYREFVLELRVGYGERSNMRAQIAEKEFRIFIDMVIAQLT